MRESKHSLKLSFCDIEQMCCVGILAHGRHSACLAEKDLSPLINVWLMEKTDYPLSVGNRLTTKINLFNSGQKELSYAKHLFRENNVFT